MKQVLDPRDRKPVKCNVYLEFECTRDRNIFAVVFWKNCKCFSYICTGVYRSLREYDTFKSAYLRTLKLFNQLVKSF